nr:MAG TPA: hypothetical protein [Caudoviricetes sp.]
MRLTTPNYKLPRKQNSLWKASSTLKCTTKPT